MKAPERVWRLVSPAAIIGLSALLAAFAAPDAFPDWAFPAANMQKPKAGWDATIPLELPGATRSFTDAALHDPYAAPDWFPSSHSPAPAVVLNGRRGKLAACGFCHLPDGSGRPENASLSGLPADYIRRQVTAFRTGTRKAAAPDWPATALMTRVAADAKGVLLVGETGQALTRISAHVDDVNGVVFDMAEASRTQAASLREINAAVNQMDQVTQQNAAMVEQSTAAANALRQETDEMAALVSQFKVGGLSTSPIQLRPPTQSAPLGLSPQASRNSQGAGRLRHG